MATYNGWTNYETWRANLELVDGLSIFDIVPDFDRDTTVDEAATCLREYITVMMEDVYNIDFSTFVGSLVDRFLYEVDWVQIAEHMVYDARIEEFDFNPGP